MDTSETTEVPLAIFNIVCRVVRKMESGATKDAPMGDDVTASPQLQITLVDAGGYNNIWLVKNPAVHKHASDISFILRVPKENSLQPHQTLNEVGWHSYVKQHCPEIPVPEIYDFSVGLDPSAMSFIAMEYIDGTPLCKTWESYSQSDKDHVAHKLAETVVRLGEERFPLIGGMTPPGTAGPSVERSKMNGGRDNFHNSACYDIGPYASKKQYILAAYDKEIYYYTHPVLHTLNINLFKCDTTPEDFVKQLRISRSTAEANLAAKQLPDESFVLCHGDLHGRNILMRGTDIVAVIDWEFAGSFPLSELIDEPIEVMEHSSGGEASQGAILRWETQILSLVEEIARERGWASSEVELLVRGGDPLFQAARYEMISE